VPPISSNEHLETEKPQAQCDGAVSHAATFVQDIKVKLHEHFMKEGMAENPREATGRFRVCRLFFHAKGRAVRSATHKLAVERKRYSRYLEEYWICVVF
jgi:hypothetical protein